jgi:hypothetical protein
MALLGIFLTLCFLCRRSALLYPSKTEVYQNVLKSSGGALQNVHCVCVGRTGGLGLVVGYSENSAKRKYAVRENYKVVMLK